MAWSADEIRASGKKTLDDLFAQRKQEDDQLIQQSNKIFDAAAESATSGYRQSMEQAPVSALEQKEDNALIEAINRKQVAESMANMGLMDSGLNRTQQTALTLQRGNADAEVDRQTRDYVNQLQIAIDEVMSETAMQKANNAMGIQKETTDWYTAALAELENTAQSAAATAYAADVQAKVEAIAKSDGYRQSYVENLMNNQGYDEEAAWAAAYTRYPGQNEQMNAYYKAYDNAIKSGYNSNYAKAIAEATVNGTDVDSAILNVEIDEIDKSNFTSLADALDFFDKIAVDNAPNPKSAIKDKTSHWDANMWEKAVEKMVNTAYKNARKAYPSASEEAIDQAVAIAVGQALNGYADHYSHTISEALATHFDTKAWEKATVAAGWDWEDIISPALRSSNNGASNNSDGSIDLISGTNSFNSSNKKDGIIRIGI